MKLNQYQTSALEFAMYPENSLYPVLGLVEEAGEVAGKFAKLIRKGQDMVNEEDRKAIALELGDTLWMLAAIAKELDYKLEEVAEMNLAKLLDRQNRNKIEGEGDNR